MSSKVSTEVYGLILSGGKSSRMGLNKGRLVYHDLPQEEHLYKILTESLPQVFISKKHTTENQLPTITDKYKIDSPLNGILSAFEAHSQVAWLVVGCDMPLIEQSDIKKLLNERAKRKISTCFLSDDEKPHPLFAIYEPKSYSLIKAFAESNISPRKFLIDNSTHIKMIKAENDHLTGANTPEEMHLLMQRINNI